MTSRLGHRDLYSPIDVTPIPHMKLLDQIHATISLGEDSGYIAECREIAVMTQGQTLDEITLNLREAVELYLEDEDPIELGLTPKPSLVITFELQPEYA
jgi:predicted RNase H-like HicB family nuclease